jgi:hypothetical protein
VTDVAVDVCASCGAPQPGRFCERCGEKRITTHDYSIVHFGETLLETLTHFDYRSVRALWVLVAKPGLLTRDYLDGRRKPYVGPIQLFVIINLFSALLSFNTFRTPLYIQERDPPFAATKRAMAAEAQSHGGKTREEFVKEFDRTAGVQAKTWIFSMIPVYALLLMVVYGFRRYYFEHLVFATHFYAFMLLWLLVGGLAAILILWLAGITLSGEAMQNGVGGVIVAGLAVYLYFALRRTYGDGAAAATARAIVLAALFFPVVQLYRLLLFFVTLNTMH